MQSIKQDMGSLLSTKARAQSFYSEKEQIKLFEELKEIALKNTDKPDELEKLYDYLSDFIRNNPKTKDIDAWIDLGRSLCFLFSKFVFLFRTIKPDWSLLDYLQNELIQYEIAHFHLDSEQFEVKYKLARQAMCFLLAHRDEDDEKLIASVENEKNLDPIILFCFKSIIPFYLQHPTTIKPYPREPREEFAVTKNISIPEHKEASMLTVGKQPGGSLIFKIKRVVATKGKDTEADKNLHVWLEKNVGYIEPISGAIAHALYPTGTSKHGLLKKNDGEHSAINKYCNNLILLGNITKRQDINKLMGYLIKGEKFKLFDYPVIGLISLLVVSDWVLHNKDLHSSNLGVVFKNNKYRFILFDYDRTGPWNNEWEGEPLLVALETGNLSLLKKTLISYATRCMKNWERYFLTDLINDYETTAILAEFKELISNASVFTTSSSRKLKPVLDPEKAIVIQQRLVRLKKAIEKFSCKIAPETENQQATAIHDPASRPYFFSNNRKSLTASTLAGLVTGLATGGITSILILTGTVVSPFCLGLVFIPIAILGCAEIGLMSGFFMGLIASLCDKYLSPLVESMTDSYAAKDLESNQTQSLIL